MSTNYPSVCFLCGMFGFVAIRVFLGLCSLVSEQHRAVFLLSQHVIPEHAETN